MKFVKFALVLAIALCLTASVYAETQSVKVSGDLTVRGIWRDSYDYRSVTPQLGGVGVARTGLTSDTVGMNAAGAAMVPGTPQNWIMSTTEVQVDADLTDNVSTVVRVLNERDWNVQNKSWLVGQDLRPNGLGAYTPNSNEFDVRLDQAYVALKSFIYSPLSVTIGRQDLWFGKGFVIGSNHVFNNWVNNFSIASPIAGQAVQPALLSAPEYTAQTAFDSVKAVLDYDPWTITGIYSSIMNNVISNADGIDLWGLNAAYKFDTYKAEAEGYWFFKRDNSMENWGPDSSGNNNVHTLGIRGSMDPIDVVTVTGEYAYQFGKYTASPTQYFDRNRSAYALDVSAEFRGIMNSFSWKPKLGLEYVLYSGNKEKSQANDQRSAYTGWDPMFRGKFDSAIREFVGTYYTSYDYPARTYSTSTAPDASFTNQSQLIFSSNIQPIDSVVLKGNYNLFWNMEKYTATRTQRGVDYDNLGFIGQELDLQATWDYTEDVSFGLLAAWFMPSEQMYETSHAVASDVVGTVKVSF